tara:strand:- start:229 stop:480 length:252 start_codon:yes stop_codon:yes gene_type:complete
MIDIKNHCVSCYKDTSCGSGLFVNRIPASAEKYEGYMCVKCQYYECECDRCDKPIPIDADIWVDGYIRVHEECLTKSELESIY